ncbi:MAG: DnaJ domain-containing protein [Cellvibrionaceae bacterium]|nr:DnaJ domain-containing protein [Cellvibrionaceae bacterium]
MEYRDYYQILGVERGADQDAIKRSYRKLARKYHPDVSKETDAEAKFKELNEAYEVLKDPEKRAAYDQLGNNWQAGQDFRPPPGWDQGFEFHGGYTQVDPEQFSDFFESLFGRGGFGSQGFQHAGGRNRRGENTHAKILIDLEDAYKGATRTLTLRHSEIGADGRPQIRERAINVKIPKGIAPGQQIRLSGQGEAGLGGAGAGDLYLEVEFKPHALYHLDGKTVYLDLPVTPWEAALGATVRAPTPTGAVDLRIPPNSRAGSKLRLKGRGLPSKEPGDLFVVLQIALPPADSEAAKTAYRQMEKAFNFEPRAGLGA